VLNWYPDACAACVTTPRGDPWSACESFTPAYPAPGLSCWSLIGKIGANGTPFQVGDYLSFAAPSSGEFFLGVNDNYPPDNTGNWTVTMLTPYAQSLLPPLRLGRRESDPSATLTVDDIILKTGRSSVLFALREGARLSRFSMPAH